MSLARYALACEVYAVANVVERVNRLNLEYVSLVVSEVRVSLDSLCLRRSTFFATATTIRKASSNIQ